MVEVIAFVINRASTNARAAANTIWRWRSATHPADVVSYAQHAASRVTLGCSSCCHRRSCARNASRCGNASRHPACQSRCSTSSRLVSWTLRKFAVIKSVVHCMSTVCRLQIDVSCYEERCKLTVTFLLWSIKWSPNASQ